MFGVIRLRENSDVINCIENRTQIIGYGSDSGIKSEYETKEYLKTTVVTRL